MAHGLVLMAEIVGVHGVKGAVKVKPLCAEPQRLMDLMPLVDNEGREFRFSSLSPHGKTYLAAIEGISDRTRAETLRGVKLHVPRARLPALEGDAYYYGDLVGLAAQDAAGMALGEVLQVVNFGAGDLLEIRPPKGPTYFLPFTQAVVPEIDLEKRIVIIAPPEFV